MRPDAASLRQIEASDPGVSTWLSANAGSGKTRVLTDRVARLLLNGTAPAHILCLTYTKAAATEMQNRLFQRLGEWAMLADDRLRAELAKLGLDDSPDDQALRRARRLFAHAIETPGGLRIQTIHSFCASLLRRFPLESGVSPNFVELDDRAAALLREEVIEDMAAGSNPLAVARLAALATDQTMPVLAAEIARNRLAMTRPLTDPGDCRALFGLPRGETMAGLLGRTVLPGDAALVADLIPLLRAGSAADQGAADRLAGLALDAPDAEALRALEGVLLYGKTAKAGPYAAKIDAFPTKATRAALGEPRLAALEGLMRRVEAARPLRLSLLAADRTEALHAFAAAFLPEYDRRKEARGALDFDDLIARARHLLTKSDVAQWVLYRLDGGIDHLLVDEAQDTSPDQWAVIRLLTEEFTAGLGARDERRTIFVVGDVKQSIYSFQGADVSTFAAMRADYAGRLAAADDRLAQMTLEHSFRSSQTILDLVDRSLDEPARAQMGDPFRHIAFRDRMPGRVELWPPILPGESAKPENWYDPVDLVSAEDPVARLAREVARRIRALLDEGARIPTPDGSRPLHAGDVLILVRRRSPLFSEIIRACKAERLPIAGADRLKLGAELAVRDLGSLLAFLVTPEDDLALAEALRSPLFALSEGDLFDLAQGRPGTLWDALLAQADRHPRVLAVLHDLRAQTDFLRPFDLVERALTRHEGRARLLARLGPEAEDGIDELLSQALAYERSDVPSLTGFLSWLHTDDVEVKRQGESGGQVVRVMTVHGAKGLEAPLVILPDTADYAPPDRELLLRLDGGPMIWKPRADDAPPAVAAAQAARAAAQERESLRLMYVALTRAQSWLIVAAAGKLKSETSDAPNGRPAWYDRIRAGMEAAGARPDGDGGLVLRDEAWPAPAGPARPAAGPPPPPPLPDWARRPAPPAANAPLPLSPSDLGGAKVLAAEAGHDSAGAQARGTDLHRLLQHLAGRDPAEWAALAAAILPDSAARALRLAEVSRVLADPALAHLFGPGSLAEVEITADLDGQPMLGAIDRLVVAPDRILAVDYKSNALVPDHPGQVPEGILRQMRAYVRGLRQIFPGRRVEGAILWTGPVRLMPLPDL